MPAGRFAVASALSAGVFGVPLALPSPVGEHAQLPARQRFTARILAADRLQPVKPVLQACTQVVAFGWCLEQGPRHQAQVVRQLLRQPSQVRNQEVAIGL
jgi:hypothetical protein